MAHRVRRRRERFLREDRAADLRWQQLHSTTPAGSLWLFGDLVDASEDRLVLLSTPHGGPRYMRLGDWREIEDMLEFGVVHQHGGLSILTSRNRRAYGWGRWG